MPEYDFTTLSDYEFEGLTRDLLQRELGTTLESFDPGKDSGIDLRGFCDGNRSPLIIQCKHYARSGYSALKRSLLKSEISKIGRLKPARYVLVTSVGLSPSRKRELRKLLAPYVLSDDDILGRRDLNNLLGKFPDVERQNFKLWLTSVAVLERVLHSNVFMRTHGLLETIADRTRVYVNNGSFARAEALLEEHRVCIISGPPGIGKSILAEMLMVKYMDVGFEPYLVSTDISEAEAVWSPSARQLFYYDDFLGQTSVQDKLNKNEDDRLTRFLSRVRAMPNKYCILTTREYILQDAKLAYEKLDRGNVDLYKCVIDLEDYTKLRRAEILYNHLYFSTLSLASKIAVAHNKKYMDVVEHPNFSPRLIEQAIAFGVSDELGGENFVNLLLEVLSDPSLIYRHAYENQLTSHGRYVLLALTTLPSEVTMDDLLTASRSLYRIQNGELDRHGVERAMRVLEGTFTRSERRAKTVTVRFHNPSVRDFMVGRVARDDDIVDELIEGATYFEQFQLLHQHAIAAGSSHNSPLTSVLSDHGRRLRTLQDGIADAYDRDLFTRLPGSTREQRLLRVLGVRSWSTLEQLNWLSVRIRLLFDTWNLHTLVGDCLALGKTFEQIFNACIASGSSAGRAIALGTAIYVVSPSQYWHAVDRLFVGDPSSLDELWSALTLMEARRGSYSVRQRAQVRRALREAVNEELDQLLMFAANEDGALSIVEPATTTLWQISTDLRIPVKTKLRQLDGYLDSLYRGSDDRTLLTRGGNPSVAEESDMAIHDMFDCLVSSLDT